MELQQYIRHGDRVQLTDVRGNRVSGTLSTLSDAVLALTTSEGRRVFSPADVFEVRRRRDSVLNGTLLGLAIGTGGGLAVGLAVDHARGEGTWLAPSVTLAGAGIGALGGFLGDALRSHTGVVFRRPQERAGPLVAPVVFQGRVGIEAVIRF